MTPYLLAIESHACDGNPTNYSFGRGISCPKAPLQSLMGFVTLEFPNSIEPASFQLHPGTIYTVPIPSRIGETGTVRCAIAAVAAGTWFYTSPRTVSRPVHRATDSGPVQTVRPPPIIAAGTRCDCHLPLTPSPPGSDSHPAPPALIPISRTETGQHLDQPAPPCSPPLPGPDLPVLLSPTSCGATPLL